MFHGSVAHFFLSLNNIPLDGYTIVCLAIHLLKDILAASTFWKSKGVLNITCTFLYAHKFSTHVGK